MQDHSVSSDGWDQPEELKNIEPYQNRRFLFHYGKALGIVQSNQYSLEPDMVSGWRPKFPSACPLPLSYQNLYVDNLKKHFQQKKNYKIVYHGERPINSVKVNQRYSYHWKYRSRYSLNVNSIKQAIANIGVQNDIDDISLSETAHKFDSSFQSGNLDLVVEVSRNQYNCFVRSDTNTRGHSNWYYFKIENKQQLGTVTLNICNITKAKNLYHQGMKPYCKIGQSGQWSQNHCTNVNFFERLCPYGLPFKTNNLQFCLQFRQAYQQIYVAYGIPYTYSDLQKFVNLLKEKEKNYIRVTSLCDSLGGVELPLITVEMNKAKFAKLQRSIHRRNSKKKAILITARIHPGQSQSSFLIQGFIQNLLKDKDSLEQILFNQYIFYIVPMMNPDGVIAGNFRTSYSGKDLNRQFNELDKCIFPQIFAIKELCEKIKNENREIEYFFDFHTHSSKKNMFCYGPEHPQNSIKYYRAKAVAKIMNSMGSIFSYKDSIFTICQQKKNTARAFMLRVMNVPMSFTFQISNGLYLEKNQKLQCLDKNILIEAGGLIYSSLLRYLELDLSSCFRKIIKHKVDNKYTKITVSQSKYSPRSTSKRKSQFRNDMTSSVWKNKLEVGQEWKFKQSKDCTLIQLINQIKNEPKNQINNFEGGSDSEASDQDMTNEEVKKLFSIIKQDRKIEQYKAPKFEEIKKIESEVVRKKRDILVDTLVFPHSNSNKRISQPSRSPFTLLNLKTDSKAPRLKRASRENIKVAVAPKHFTLLI